MTNLFQCGFLWRRNNADEHTLTQLSFSTKYQRWNTIESSALNRRNSFILVSTLFFQCWNHTDKWTSTELSFLTKCQRWNNVDERWRSTSFQPWFKLDVFAGLYLTNFKLFFFLINVQVHSVFHEKSDEKLLLFFLNDSTVLLFYSIVWIFSEDDTGIHGSKKTFYQLCFSFKKLKCKIKRLSNHRNISPCCYQLCFSFKKLKCKIKRHSNHRDISPCSNLRVGPRECGSIID